MLAAFERTIAALVWVVFALHITGCCPRSQKFFDGITFTLGQAAISLLTIGRGAFWIFVIVLAPSGSARALDRG